MTRKTISELERRIEELEATAEANAATVNALIQECSLRAERIVQLDRENQTLRSGGQPPAA